MPPKVKITKKMVEEASLEVIRSSGYENLNARTIAEYLKCSTQPVLYSFKTVDEIREAAYRLADDYHTAFIMPKDTGKNPMLALGLNYVRFGHEEKNLFRFLFQSGRFSDLSLEDLIGDPEVAGVLDTLGSEEGLDPEETAAFFEPLFAIVHGYASLIANNAVKYDPESISKALITIIEGLERMK